MLSEKSRCLFPHIWGQGSQQWYNIFCNINHWPLYSRSGAFLRDLPYLRLGLCYRRDLGIYSRIFEVKNHNYDITNTAWSSRDLQTQGHELLCVIFHVSVSSVYFHIFEVKDQNNDITNTSKLTIDLKIQGHELFCVTFYKYCSVIPWLSNSRSHAIFRDLPYLRLCSFCQKDLGVYFHIFEVQDHNNDKINTAMLTFILWSSNSRSLAILRDLPYLWLNSWYRKIWRITMLLWIILRLRQFTFNFNVTRFLPDLQFLRFRPCYRKVLGVYFHVNEVEDRNVDEINTANSTVILRIQGRALFCVTFHITGSILAI